MIDFKTYEEQIEILKNRNLIIDNEKSAKKILALHNYYNVINGYKDIFLKKGINPETFNKGTHFNEIVAIHQFDKCLKNELLRPLALIERTVKSVISYEFSKAHPNHDYLNINNFDNTNIVGCSRLMTKLNKVKISAINDLNPMIMHYHTKYNAIPLWVFVNLLTFGTVSKFFNFMKQSEKSNVCKRISSIIGYSIFPDEMENTIKILVLLRNNCAHDQRIYDFNSGALFVSQKNPLLKEYSISTPKNDLFGAIACLKILSEDYSFNLLKSNLNNTYRDISQKIISIAPEQFSLASGIPQDFLAEQL